MSIVIYRKAAMMFVLAAAIICVGFAQFARADDVVPVVNIPAGITSLDDIGLYGVSYTYLDGRTGSKPIGWIGHFDDETGISVTPYGSQNGERVFLLHPIWHGGTGDTDQTFRLRLPKASSISLSFAIAMETEVVGKSDGATYRLFINGDKQLDQNKTDGVWSEYKFDLTKYAGHIVTIKFEIDPGPKHDSSWDYAFWGNRRITCAGVSEASPPPMFNAEHPALDGTASGWGSASPAHLIAASAGARISSAAAPSPKSLFDGLSFRLNNGNKRQSLPFATSASLDLVAPDGKIVSSESPDANAVVTQTKLPRGVIRRTAVYTLSSRSITVTENIYPYNGSSARVTLNSDDPYVAAVHFGRVGPVAFERHIAVPYYGTIEFSTELGLFWNIPIDYGMSNAGRLDNNTAYYDALTDGTRNTLAETVYYALSPDPDAVVPTPINEPSPYRKTMGGLAVIDYWGGDAAGLAKTLNEQATYGLTKYFVLIHNWQHGGYDQQLPQVLPANDYIGGNAGLETLSNTTKRLGELFGVHENYVDFYPNGPLYNQSEIAVTPDGKPIPAWMWPGHISYLMTPVVMHKYASLITPQVHAQLGTTASYLDVHSAIPPFVHTDYRAGRPGAAKFETMIHAQKDLWQLMRDIHGGPVLGEGNNHWYWSGMLDGVEAQFGTGVTQEQAEKAPLYVDFDLLKIHPRQINHGMGYLERWLPTEGEKPPTLAQLDDYRMQEVAFGHSAFISNNNATFNLPFMWEEHNLVIPVASRYSDAKVEHIAYETNGKMLDTADAVAAGSVFDRVRVTYGNGLTIWANSRPAPWNVSVEDQTVNLPQYGWVAAGDGVFANVSTRSGAIAAFAQTATSIFADARTAIVYKAGEESYASPYVSDCSQTAPNTIQLRFTYQVNRTIPDGYVPFVHFVTADDQIVAQSSIGISSEPSSWPIGLIPGNIVTATLPATNATYEIRVGLYSPTTGDRLSLDGNNDGEHRIKLATVTVSNDGRTIKFSSVPAVKPEYQLATHFADFGVLSTNGSVKLTKVGPSDWILIPLPRKHPFTVNLAGKSIDAAFANIKATPINAQHEAVGAVISLKVVNGRNQLNVDLPPDAIGYRLTN